MDISVVIPVYGCPEALPRLCDQLVVVLERMGVSFEIILVDDCDLMGSWNEVKKISALDSRVKGLRFTHNCGQDIAIKAGVCNAVGDWIITMDCDLQDSPEYIPALYEKALSGGKDVVFMRRKDIKASFVSRIFARLFHRIFSYYAGIPFGYEIATFLIASKRAAELYSRSKERGCDFGMYLMWLDYKRDYLEYEHGERFSGKSSYTFAKKVNYALRMMTTFSNRILYLPIHVGTVVTVGALIYMFIALVEFFAFDSNPEGWTAILGFVILFGGIILCTLGIIGVYLGNIFDVTKNRPLYVIQESINYERENVI